MGAVTLTNLIARSRSRADMPLAGFVSAQELLDWINEGAQQVHEKLVSAYGEEYVSTSANLVVASGAAPLPSNFFKLQTIEMSIAGVTRTLLPYVQQERNAYRNIPNIIGTTKPRYKIVAGNVQLYPVQPNGTIISITYAPEFTLLAAAGDTTSFPNGWEKWVVTYAAMQMLEKEESDARSLQGLLKQWSDDLEVLRANRDAAAPVQAVDVDMVENDDFIWGT